MLHAVYATLSLAVLTAGQASSRPAAVSPSPQRPLSTMVEAELRTNRISFPVNSPIPVEFVLRNITTDYVKLEVPLGSLASRLPECKTPPAMGLPVEHIFSGDYFRGLSIAVEGDPYIGDSVMIAPSTCVPPIVLAPYAEVGIKFDISRYYPRLRQEGRYELRWRPYHGQIDSRPILIDVRPYKQVIMDTDAGRLTFRLFYDRAPQTVDNFLTLVGQHFYDGLDFFAVNPSLAAQAGDPKHNRTGRASDGHVIPPEFNDTPFDFGTVGMSLTSLPGNQVDPNSASCQFFICLTRAPALDGRYTAFAQVEGPDSRETLRKIAAGPRNANGTPVKPVVIRSASIQNAPVSPTP